MKRFMSPCFCSIILLCVLVVFLSACGEKQKSGGDEEPVANTNIAQSFASLQEFEEAEKKRTDGMSAYYLPVVPQEQYRLSGISKLEGIYFTTRYQFVGDIKPTEAVSEYGKELLMYLSCTQYLFSEPDGTIEMYQKNGFQEVRNGDRIYYFKEERDALNNNALLGYEILFVEDRTAIYMHLPAVSSLTEALKYTEVEKHLIDRR